jgi:hypothetical protein
MLSVPIAITQSRSSKVFRPKALAARTFIIANFKPEGFR